MGLAWFLLLAQGVDVPTMGPVPILSWSAFFAVVCSAIGYGALREKVLSAEKSKKEITGSIDKLGSELWARFDKWEAAAERREREVDKKLEGLRIDITRLQERKR